ncbi:MAG TPA: hypothetical protein VLV49_19080 [Terriglobales bacterium]|nr:hypothetical protein [Terriglobales bacterium]
MNSRGGAIVLTATVSQSMTVTVSPAQQEASSPFLAEDGAAAGPVITANWVLGPGNISMAVLSSGNPLLGNDAISRVPVAAFSPMFPLLSHSDDSLPANNFLPAAGTPAPGSQLELKIDTSRLQIPAGSQNGVLTIRAQAF